MRHPQFVRRNIKLLILTTVALFLANTASANPPPPLNASLDTKKLLADPEAWVTGLISLPPHAFHHWQNPATVEDLDPFGDKEHPTWRPIPDLPKPGLSAEQQREHILTHSAALLDFFAKENLPLPKGTVLIYDLATYTLAASTTAGSLLELMSYADRYLDQEKPHLQMQFQIFQTDSKTARQMLDEAGKTFDHTTTLEKLITLRQQGIAQEMVSQNLQVSKDDKIIATQGTDITRTAGFFAKDNQVEWVTEKAHHGTLLEASSSIAPYRSAIASNFNLKHHFLRPKQWQQELPLGVALPSNVKLPLSAFGVVDLTSSTILFNKQSRMIGSWKVPYQNSKTQIAFVTPRILFTLPEQNESLLSRLKNVTATLPEPATVKVAADILKKMEVREYTMPPGHSWSEVQAQSNDSFSSTSHTKFFVTTIEHLNSVGIAHSEGSYAYYDPENWVLKVRGTRQDRDAIDAYISSFRTNPPTFLTYTLEIIEADEATMQGTIKQAQSSADHTRIWNELRALDENGQVSILQSMQTDARSGQRLKFNTGLQKDKLIDIRFGKDESIVGGPVDDNEPDEKAATEKLKFDKDFMTGEIELQNIGTSWEMDAVLGPDGYTMQVNLHVADDLAKGQTAEQIMDSEMPAPQSSLLTSLLMHSGSTRMIATWKSGEDGSERIKAAFLHAKLHVRRLNEKLTDSDEQ